MARAGVTAQFNKSSRFATNLRKKGKAKFGPKFDLIGQAMVNEARTIVERELIPDRIPSRRKPGPRLVNSFRYEVIGTEFPIRVRLYSIKNQKAVAALNYGARPHAITATKARGLWFPAPRSGRITQAYGTRGGGRGTVATRFAFIPRGKVVVHPGNKAYGFFERAQENVKRKVLAGTFRAR